MKQRIKKKLYGRQSPVTRKFASAVLILAIVLVLFRMFTGSEQSLALNPEASEQAISYRDTYIEAVNLLLSNPDSALAIAQNILQKSESGGITEELIPYYNIVGIYYRNQAMYDKSIETFYAYLEYALKYNKQQYIAEAYENIGQVNFLTYRYKDALGMMLKSLDIYREQNDSLKIAWVYNSLGRIYFEIGDLNKAKTYYGMAYDIFISQNFHLGISSVSNHMAKYYLETSKTESALMFINKAIIHAEATGNNYGLSNIYLEKGALFLETGDYSQAIKNFQISDSIADNLRFTPLNIFPKLALAETYTRLGNYAEAGKYLQLSKELSSAHNSDKLLYRLNNAYAQFYDKKGNMALAYSYYKLANEHKEAMVSQSETFQVYNIEIEQLSRKMEIQDMEMKKQAMLLAQRKNTMVLIIVVSVFVIVLLSLLYYFYLSRMRQAEKEKMHSQELKYSYEKNQAVLEAEINERKRLASELHDGIGTHLSLAKLTLSNIIGRPGLSGEKKEHLIKSTVSSIDDIIKEVKILSDSMTPLALGEKGLKEAIKEMVVRYGQLRNCRIKLSMIGLNNSLKPLASHAIYRSVQELVANALKHAACSEINIQILKNDDELLIMIEDDGKGFDTEHPDIQNRHGLKNARSRIDSLNGHLLIDSTVGRGTIITITIPLKDLEIITIKE